MPTPSYLDDRLWVPAAEALFVRPDWKALAGQIEAGHEAAERPAAWSILLQRWLGALQGVLNELMDGPGSRRALYRVDLTPHYLFLLAYPADMAAEISRLGEAFYTLALRTLGPRVVRPFPHPYPVLIFHSPVVAREYLAYYGVDADRVKGAFLTFDIPQIVVQQADRFLLRLTLLHEMTHAVLHPLPVPVWIHEGLSRYFESLLLSKSNLVYANSVDLGRNRYWREHGLGDFWSGAVFFDGRASIGYSLAERLIKRLLGGDPERFAEFVLRAQAVDAGAAACRAVYGHALEPLALSLAGGAVSAGGLSG